LKLVPNGLLAATLALGASWGCGGAVAPVEVVLQTERGDIVVRLDPLRAPITTANFLRYVDDGLFDDAASFYRTVTLEPDNQSDNDVKIEVIQGGLDVDDVGPLPPIEHETTRQSGLGHLDGTISMARLAPGTASSEFFICVGDQPELDFGGRRNPDGQGFAAFGRVVEGMETVRAIHRAPREGQRLSPPVRILTVRRR